MTFNKEIIISNDIECGDVNAYQDKVSEDDEQSQNMIISATTRCLLRRLSIALVALSISYVLIDEIDVHSSRRIILESNNSFGIGNSRDTDHSWIDVNFDVEHDRTDDYTFEYMTDDQLRNDNTQVLQRFMVWNKKQLAQSNHLSHHTSGNLPGDEFQYIETNNNEKIESERSTPESNDRGFHHQVDAVDLVRQPKENFSAEDINGPSLTFPYASDDELRDVNLNIIGKFEMWKSQHDKQQNSFEEN
jgi:hypothetical protein